MEKISCDVIQDLLPLYMDQVVSEDSRRLVEEHVEHCQTCERILEDMRSDFPVLDMEEKEETSEKELESFRKFLSRKKGKLIAVSVIAAAALLIGIAAFMNAYVVYVDYDKAGITIYEENQDVLWYQTNIRGNYSWCTDLNEDTGIMKIHFEQSLWDRYISGIFHPFDHIHHIIKKDMIKEIYVDEDGTETVIWEASSEEKEEYFSREPNQPLG